MNLKMMSMAAVLGAVVALEAGAQTGWKPERAVEYVVPSTPGGAVDISVRLMKKILEESKTIAQPMVVVYKPGGNMTIALDYLTQFRGDGHHLGTSAHIMVTGKIVGDLNYTLADVTPVALLFKEFVGVAVRADSPIASARDLVERLKKDPASLSLGMLGSPGNHIHLGTAKPLKVAGVDIRKLLIASYKSSPEAVTALLGGHVDFVTASVPNLIPHQQSGRIRILAVSAPSRLGGALAGVPTWREQGVDADFSSAQGVIGPRGMPAEQVAFWEAAFAKLSQSEEWKQHLERNIWVGNYLNSRDTIRYYDEETAKLRELLIDMGLARQ